MIFVIALILLPLVSAAEEGPAGFRLIILGTRHFSDVDLVKKNVQKLASVRDLVPIMESQQHVEYAGQLAGDPDTLVSEIEGIAADRFSVAKRDDRKMGLVITLKKIKSSENE